MTSTVSAQFSEVSQFQFHFTPAATCQCLSPPQSLSSLNLLLLTASSGALVSSTRPAEAILGKDGICAVRHWPDEREGYEGAQPAESHCTVHHIEGWHAHMHLEEHQTLHFILVLKHCGYSNVKHNKNTFFFFYSYLT